MIAERLKHLLALRLARIVKIFHTVTNRTLTQAGYDLQMDQVPVLMMLYILGGRSQQEIADKTLRDKSSIQRTITYLAKRDLVLVKQDKIDKRKNIVEITDLGKEMAHHIESIAFNINERIISCLNSKEKDMLLNIITKIEKHTREDVVC